MNLFIVFLQTIASYATYIFNYTFVSVQYVYSIKKRFNIKLDLSKIPFTQVEILNGTLNLFITVTNKYDFKNLHKLHTCLV